MHIILEPQPSSHGNVFCEANSFGVPCISTNNGGIPTVFKNNLNEKIFPKEDALVEEACKYILSLFSNSYEDKQLALSAFNELLRKLSKILLIET